MLNGVLVDVLVTPALINDLSLARWRLRTHMHEDPNKCMQCVQDMIMIGQYSNVIFNHIDALEEKLSAFRKAARHRQIVDLAE